MVPSRQCRGMPDRGRVFDTYVAALQHDIADVPDDAHRVGVVRRPAPWFHGQVDENLRALGPPEVLLDEVKTRYRELCDAGVDEDEAHNRALDEVSYDERYLEHVGSDPDARAALASIRERLDAGTDVALVCYEDTEHKRCHRTLLRDLL